MIKKRNMQNNINPLWSNDSIQFSRLLSEIYAAGLNEYQYVDLAESMNLSKAQINEIFERAESAWNVHKLNNM